MAVTFSIPHSRRAGHSRRRWLRIAIVGCLLALTVLVCLSKPFRAGIAYLRSLEAFAPLAEEPQIRSEPGIEELAHEVMRHYRAAIAVVEREHGLPFAEPPTVYVCATPESFEKHTSYSSAVKALTIGDRIFLNPAMVLQKPRVVGLLTHEMSHEHLIQRVGSYAYMAHLPEWFREGLATYVSGGGGAEEVSEDEAARAILAGDVFEPESSGRILLCRGRQSRMPPHVFYRQSMMFVRYLKELDHQAWRSLLGAIQNGEDFAAAFEQAYGTAVKTVFSRFVEREKVTATKSGHFRQSCWVLSFPSPPDLVAVTFHPPSAVSPGRHLVEVVARAK